MTGGTALAQNAPAPRTKGPIVWLDMDQKELDDAYDQAVYAPNREVVIKRCARNSELVRERIGAPEALRLWADRDRSRRRVRRQDPERAGDDLRPWRCLAHRPCARSTTIWPRLFRQCRRASRGAGLQQCRRGRRQPDDHGGSDPPFGGLDRSRTPRASAAIRIASTCPAIRRADIWAGVLLTTDWQKFGLPQDCIKGGVCGSGMYDLKPVRMSARSNYVKFTDETERELSAQRHLDKLVAPVSIVYGTDGDAGVPAAEPRLRHGCEGRRQDRDDVGDGRLQSLRGHGIDRQSVQPVRPCGAGDHEAAPSLKNKGGQGGSIGFEGHRPAGFRRRHGRAGAFARAAARHKAFRQVR